MKLYLDVRKSSFLFSSTSRVIAMLTERWTLTNELRVPAISRLQKIHNIGISFRILQEMGLELSTVKGEISTEITFPPGHPGISDLFQMYYLKRNVKIPFLEQIT